MAVFRTNSRVASVVVAMIGLFLLQNPALEAHTTSAKSTISIRFEDGEFRGRVESSRPKCEENRLVKVFKERRSRPDVFIGEDRTNDNGRYVVPKPKRIEGKFYARVSKRSGGGYQHKHRCRGATSDTIKAP